MVERPAATREGILMATLKNMKARPWWVSVAAAAAIAIGLLFIPISYTQTVGQNITLTLADGDLDPATVKGVAKALTEALDADNVGVLQRDGLEFKVQVSNRPASEVRAAASAFAAELSDQGIAAEVEVTPWTEKVSGNVYAFAAARVTDIRVPTAGRSDFEIAEDVRAQLQNAGFLNPEVSVVRNGGDTEIKINATESDGGTHETHIKLEFNNSETGGAQPDINFMMLDHKSFEGKSDAEIKAAVEELLRQRGIHDATVTVDNGKIEVRAEEEIVK